MVGRMDALPDAVVQYILSHMKIARDVAVCNCVSQKWKESMSYIRSLYYPRNCFDNYIGNGKGSSDEIIREMVSSVVRLEKLVVYCPFSGAGLSSWLSVIGSSLTHLELRMDNLAEQQGCHENSSKLDCISVAKNLESLTLWGVLMTHSPKWDVFTKLKNLEIVGARMKDSTLTAVLRACPNMIYLLLLGCEGLRYVSIELPNLQQCKLDFYGIGNCSFSMNCPAIELLDVQGCSVLRVPDTKCLKNLSIANNTGRVHKVDFGKLASLEFLTIRGMHWCWDAISNMLQMAGEVKHLYMRVEFTGDLDTLQPFPEIDFVDFFNNHPKLQRWIHRL